MFLRDFGEDLISTTRKQNVEERNQTNNILNNILKYFDFNDDEFDMETMVDEFLTFFVAG